MQPTGNVRVRPSSFGKKLILQVEVTGIHTYSIGGHIDSEHVTEWRDAKVEDLARVNVWGSTK